MAAETTLDNWIVNGLAEHLCALFGAATWEQLGDEVQDGYRKVARSALIAIDALSGDPRRTPNGG